MRFKFFFLSCVVLTFCYSQDWGEITPYKAKNLNYSLHLKRISKNYQYLYIKSNSLIPVDIINNNLCDEWEEPDEAGEYSISRFIYASNNLLTVEVKLCYIDRKSDEKVFVQEGININMKLGLLYTPYDQLYEPHEPNNFFKASFQKKLGKILFSKLKSKTTELGDLIHSGKIKLGNVFPDSFCICRNGIRFYYEEGHFYLRIRHNLPDVKNFTIDVSFSELSEIINKDGPLKEFFSN